VKMSGHGIEVDVPKGWEGRIYRRGAQATLHVANFPLPVEDGDFGSGAISLMRNDGVFIALTEYEGEVAESGLFAARGLPSAVGEGDFDPRAMQRMVAGRSGLQRFFTVKGRPFCLYVVIGVPAARREEVRAVNQLLGSVRIATLEAH
jgi:hypothetical protein